MTAPAAKPPTQEHKPPRSIAARFDGIISRLTKAIGQRQA